jgi:biotin operon repressor
MMDELALARLEAKSPEAAIIECIQRDFNLAPFLAKMHFERMKGYFEAYLGLECSVGQANFLALAKDNPPGRRVEECKRLSIRLTVDCSDDLMAFRRGVAALRQSKIQRLSEEAYEQDALLTHEDLARLLCCSPATIKRDVAVLRGKGLSIPTREQVKDIGKGLSHKIQIVRDYLAGYTFSDIEMRRRHTIPSIHRYCRDFGRVVTLWAKSLSVNDIRQATGLSERLIQQYIALYQETQSDNLPLQRLLQEPNLATAEPALIKRGAWLR